MMLKIVLTKKRGVYFLQLKCIDKSTKFVSMNF